mgnify:CR=1 FL=1
MNRDRFHLEGPYQSLHSGLKRGQFMLFVLAEIPKVF